MSGSATAAENKYLGTLREERLPEPRHRRQLVVLSVLLAGQLAWIAVLGWLVARLIA